MTGTVPCPSRLSPPDPEPPPYHSAGQRPTSARFRVCTSDGGVNLTALQDPAFPTGAWSGTAWRVLFSTRAGGRAVEWQFHLYPEQQPLPGNDDRFRQPATFYHRRSGCSLLLLNNVDYTVSFNIIGGDPGSYVVNVPAELPAFASPPIPSGSSYSFLVDDGNGCGDGNRQFQLRLRDLRWIDESVYTSC